MIVETNLDELAELFSDRLMGQAEWVVHAWNVLASAGLVPRDVDEEHPNVTHHVVTVAALAYLAAVINDEGAAEVPDIREGALAVTDFELGRYAERRGVAIEAGPDEAHLAAEVCVVQRMRSVARTLGAEIGTDTLFAELWAQRKGIYEFPLSRADASDMVNNDLSGDKMVAYEWLLEQLR